MTLLEFINKYNGKYLDFDGAYPNQCVDLAKAWESANGWPIIKGNAIEQPNNLTDFYEWIPNTPDGVPDPGDLIIWNYKPYGHIAVFVEGDINGFTSFDQNYPVGSNCHLQKHNYSNVIGWFRPKGENMSCTEDLAKVNAELTAAKKLVATLEKRSEKRGEQVEELKKEKTELETNIAELEKRPEECPTTIPADIKDMTASELIAAGIKKFLGI